MMFQNLMKKEIKIYRLVFLFFPLLGCVYWYLSRHVPMRSILHTAHGADVPISIIMEWLMLPGYILSFCMYKLLCIAIRDLRGSEEFVCFLFLASQTMFADCQAADRRGKAVTPKAADQGRRGESHPGCSGQEPE